MIQLNKKKKELLLAIILGVISVMSYIIALTHQAYITQTFTSGDWNLFLPVITAFYFSFLHGSFASNVLSVLGIVASKKTETSDKK